MEGVFCIALLQLSTYILIVYTYTYTISFTDPPTDFSTDPFNSMLLH